MRFCTACGASDTGHNTYCTVCGARFDDPPAPDPRPGPEPRPRRRRTVLVVAIIVCVMAVLTGAGVAAYLVLTRGSDGEPARSDDRTVYYASDTVLAVSNSTTVVAYGVDDEPLGSYKVLLRPDSTESDNHDWDQAELAVAGTDGFSFGSFTSLTDGRYDMVIEDSSRTDATYHCPDIRFDSSGVNADTILLRPDPDDPGSATEEVVEYGSESVTMDVDFVYHNGDSESSYDATWNYVQFTPDASGTGTSNVNTALKNRFDDELSTAKSWDADTADEGQCVSYKQQVTYLHDGVAGVRTERYLTYWGPHGEPEVTGALYDLADGTTPSLSDVTGLSDAEIRQKARDAISAFLALTPSPYTDDELAATDIDGMVSDLSRYYVADEGLIFTIRLGELGPTGYGTHEIVVDGLGVDAALPAGTDVAATYATQQW